MKCSRTEVERGQVLAKASSVKPHTKFEAQVYVLSKEEGKTYSVLLKLSTSILFPPM